MGTHILIHAGLKQHQGVLASVFALILLVTVALSTVLTLWVNAGNHVEDGLEQAGFGELTVWVSGSENWVGLGDEIADQPEVDRVETQQVVFTNYTALGLESDSEGQLILYELGRECYQFFTKDLDSYQPAPEEIQPGEVYVSPSLVSMFGLSIGDEIIFPIARSGRDLTLTVAGFYEDPVMGSSMIGMKGFLVGESDFQKAVNIANVADIDALAREGAMLHIFSSAGLPAAELNAALNEHTGLAQFTEFIHSRETIVGFMLILQNGFSAMLLAFVAVLLGAVLAVLGHSISSTIRADYKNMGVLKTVGLTTRDLRRVLLVQYGAAILAGMAMGLLLTFPVSRAASAVTLTTTGILVPTALPVGWLALSFGMILILLGAFIYWRAGIIGKISPMKAIHGEAESSPARRTNMRISGKMLPLRLALRQVISGIRLYAGALAVAVLLSFFAAMIGYMDAWLGPDGKGMMDAFNPADHDIGVQMFGDSIMEQAEEIVRRYSEDHRHLPAGYAQRQCQWRGLHR